MTYDEKRESAPILRCAKCGTAYYVVGWGFPEYICQSCRREEPPTEQSSPVSRQKA